MGSEQCQNNVLTQHNDNTRSGLNPNETRLTPANVNVSSFGKLFTQSVDGVIAGQPLYASQVLMNDGNVHNVVYVATQNNSVYAFDADSAQGNNASPLWSVSLNDGGTPDPIADYGCTGTHYTEIGIMGTPVIDPGVTTLYVVAKTVTGTGSSAVRNFSLHALDVASGKTVGWASGHYGHGAVQQRIGNVQSNLSNAASRAASAEWRGLYSIWRKRLRRICLQRLALCLQLPNSETGVRFPGDSRRGSRFDLAGR